ncbi:methyltransferase [Sphingobium aquiterrae]|uniref:class I SAM-dependent methyltransferase n=1 Tax=Sphingobium aquiterrae TaxID=2038656 RepID=UPI00301893A1
MRSPTVLYTALIFGISAIAIPALALRADAESPATAKDAIARAVAAPTRTPANAARDNYRHPAETLRFFGVKPGQTVIEYSPAGGWYTEILAPLLKDKGVFYAAQAPGRGFDSLKAKLDADPATYGKVKLVPWTAPQTVIPAGSADLVVTFRNIHNMVMGGTEAAQFKAFYDVLKPGGTLGIVDHRLPEDRDTAVEKNSGYLKTSTVRRIAEAAGFTYAGASEINANPKDTADWPDGVWTLPPTLRKGVVDRDRYLAIGESDRMTLRFTKAGR